MRKRWHIALAGAGTLPPGLHMERIRATPDCCFRLSGKPGAVRMRKRWYAALAVAGTLLLGLQLERIRATPD